MALNLDAVLEEFVQTGASDCYMTVDSPPCLRFGNRIEQYPSARLTQEDMDSALQALFTPDIIAEFESTLEYNTALMWKGARFRVNLFRQRKHTGMVLRRINTDIPSLRQLDLPPVYGELMMEKRGLILIVGQTGAGKSTSMAAMVGHRNTYGSGHIVTIEDPIEFIHEHNKCIITQRDVGIDTYSFGIALKNTLRQSPDVIVIGEIRDRETMEHAIVFSETGHLCLATLHANNSHQAIERIVNFFPEEKHKQILLNLSLNLRAVLSQRLVKSNDGPRAAALEIMLNQGIIRELIVEGRVKELREHIEKGRDGGMQSFDQALLYLYSNGTISEEAAIAESDNPGNLRLSIKQYNLGKPGAAAAAARANPALLDIPSKPQF